MKKLLAIVVLIMAVLLCSCSAKGYAFYIFSDISECEQILEQKHDDAEITVYDTPDDKYIKDLEYVNFFACDYSSSELEFEIYAYEFSSKEDAMQYFTNVTGKSNQPERSFSSSKGMFSFKVEAVDGNKVYRAVSPFYDDNDLLSFLKEIFSVEICTFD